VTSPLDELIGWATTQSESDLLAAREEWFGQSGKVFEDDRQFEARMASFLEFYACDRISPEYGLTPARRRYLEVLRTETPERARLFRNFTETLLGLYAVEAIESDSGALSAAKIQVERVIELRLSNVWTGAKAVVKDRNLLHGMKPKDLVECRLIPHAEGFRFSGAFLFHPRAAISFIESEALKRRHRDSNPSGFLFDVAQRTLKSERYRQIGISKIFDFSATKL
jgi:hypothetical protein